RFFRHDLHAEFRLVLKVGDPFPPEASAAEWDLTREREESQTAADVISEIAERGYSLFQLRARFDQIPHD
ncbi:MAG: hypothetical protein JWN20_233, partial [Jatrophihabitantaceae bacterium]|nr:hypothetical protein [Jatrophihabitantaceae bacterium]